MFRGEWQSVSSHTGPMDGVEEQDDGGIVATAWSARYGAAFDRLLKTEGGFVDDPADHGGATKYGISLRFLKAEGAFDDDHDGIADFDLDMDGDIDKRDIRALTVGDARYLYLTSFWKALDCESFPAPIGEMLFDQGVNGGNRAAKVLLQRAVNTCLASDSQALIQVDGSIGKQTREAVALSVSTLGIELLVLAYRDQVKQRYREIVRRNPSQAKFLRGWLNRADRLGQ